MNQILINFFLFSKGFSPKLGSHTPCQTTTTNTANISMRDIRSSSEKSLPLLTASSTMLQVPNVRK